jgi:hypothetical protein
VWRRVEGDVVCHPLQRDLWAKKRVALVVNHGGLEGGSDTL